MTIKTTALSALRCEAAPPTQSPEESSNKTTKAPTTVGGADALSTKPVWPPSAKELQEQRGKLKTPTSHESGFLGGRTSYLITQQGNLVARKVYGDQSVGVTRLDDPCSDDTQYGSRGLSYAIELNDWFNDRRRKLEKEVDGQPFDVGSNRSPTFPPHEMYHAALGPGAVVKIGGDTTGQTYLVVKAVDWGTGANLTLRPIDDKGGILEKEPTYYYCARAYELLRDGSWESLTPELPSGELPITVIKGCRRPRD